MKLPNTSLTTKLERAKIDPILGDDVTELSLGILAQFEHDTFTLVRLISVQTFKDTFPCPNRQD